MRRPREAPPFATIFQKISQEQQGTNPRDFQKLFAQAENAHLGKYLHWDELWHREPPKDLTREEWWFLLKLQRQSLKQFVPVADKQNSMFNLVLTPTILQSLHEMDLRAGGQIRMPEQVTNAESKDAYYVSSLIEEAITSSQLEGATTTRRVAKEMLRTGRPPRDLSERMILNNFMTMKRIGSLKDQPLSRELILEIHRLVTLQTLDDPTAAGRFRHDLERVAVYDNANNVLMHDPPPAAELEARIKSLCDFANRAEPFVHPVIRSIILHFMVGYDHPFVDGNGRTARALFYWSMLRHGYWLAEFISISQIVLKAPAQYARAFLHTETDECDLTYFILYHLRVVMGALASLHEYIARKTQEIRQFESELSQSAILNHRQRALIRHAMRHPGTFYTVKGHQLSHNVSYESARSDLLDLAKRELLEAQRTKATRGSKWIFVAKPQLAERLAAMGSRASGSGILA
jgi:Fic family protein